MDDPDLWHQIRAHTVSLRRRRLRRRLAVDQGPFVWELNPWRLLSAQTQLSYHTSQVGQPDPLTVSAFNQGQYANSPGNRAYYYAELAISSPALAVTIA